MKIPLGYEITSCWQLIKQRRSTSCLRRAKSEERWTQGRSLEKGGGRAAESRVGDPERAPQTFLVRGQLSW